MSNRKPRQPQYRRQRRPGSQPDTAYTTLSGQRIALGRYDSPESHREFARVVHEWEQRGRMREVKAVELTITQLCARYWLHIADSHRAKPENAKPMIRAIGELYGDTPARQFGPKRLKALQASMAERIGRNHKTWSRSYVNKMIRAVRSMFRWAVSEELIEATVLDALCTVEGLRARDRRARETAPRNAPPAAHVDAIKRFVARQVWAMVQLQRLTGARPGELVIMRPVDLDMSSDIWLYRPATHKMAHAGRDRVITIGPRGQDVIRPFLATRPLHSYMFSPKEAEAERRIVRRAARKSKVQPSQLDRSRPGACRLNDHYTTCTYARAITRGIKDAFRPEGMSANQFAKWKPGEHWTPHQLRHGRATEVREALGEEAAQVTLGHARIDTTRLYGERNLAKAIEVARKLG